MMDRAPVQVPSPEELKNAVTRRPEPEATPGSPAPAPPAGEKLSAEAAAFLYHAIQPGSRHLSLEERWRAIEISSGSVKKRVLAELRRQGFIRLEQKGREKHVYLYAAAWRHAGLEPPSGAGGGGMLHKRIAEYVRREFRSRGYEVRLEQEIGLRKKRVDAVLFGRRKRIGVEIGLSDARQELKNLRDDLEAEVLDAVVFVAVDKKLLQRVREAAAKDAYLVKHTEKISYFLIDEEQV